MSGRLTRSAYETLIREDLAWLEKQPRTLEREHIALIVKDSVRQEYDERETLQHALFALKALLSYHDAIGEEADDVDVKRAVAVLVKAGVR